MRSVVQEADARPDALLPGVPPALYTVTGDYTDGDYFGAEACILQVPSAEAVVARSFCKCARLPGAALDAILELFPEYLPSPEGARPPCGGHAWGTCMFRIFGGESALLYLSVRRAVCGTRG